MRNANEREWCDDNETKCCQCPMCMNEYCRMCNAGVQWGGEAKDCDHDTEERHRSPERKRGVKP